jgi:hypothetical protein
MAKPTMSLKAICPSLWTTGFPQSHASALGSESSVYPDDPFTLFVRSVVSAVSYPVSVAPCKAVSTPSVTAM